VPALRLLGVSDDVLHRMTVLEPARLLDLPA